MHEIGIESSLVDAIRRGDKTVEGRLGKPRFLAIQPGDTLAIREDVWREGTLVESHDQAVQAIVTQVLYFETFREMLEAVGYEAAIPGASSLEDALAVYRAFYSPADEAAHGVVALFIRAD